MKRLTLSIGAAILALSLYFTDHAHAVKNEEADPIIVSLQTEAKLMPLYLAPFKDVQSGFSAAYLDQLRKVLEFDLNHNGLTFTVKNTDKAASQEKDHFDQFGKIEAWKNLGVFYVIKIQVKDKNLSARMLSVHANNIKSIDNIPLTGNLSEDRRQVHHIADLVHKTLFGSPGIASTRILYTVKTQATDNQRDKWISEVWEADYDGGNARQVTQGGGYCVTPVYIPPQPGYSSGSFLYASYKTGQPKLYVSSVSDGEGIRFSYLRGNQLMPAISRQRDQVAFISDVTGNPDLFLQPFSPEKGPIGKPRQIFRTYMATQGSPAFSPDGKQIAFVSNKDGSPQIYVMEIPAEGTKLKDIKARLITKTNRENTAPAWSPDGTKLAYSAMTKGTRQIWIYDFDKNQEWQLTQGAGHKENPTWASNSLHLIFNSSDDNASDLYLVNLNQPKAAKITSGSGEKRFPNWEP